MANRYKVVTNELYPHFITCTIVQWLPIFATAPYAQIVLDSLTYLTLHRNLEIHAYVIMPTHLHAIITANNNDLSAVMRDFKKFTSRSIFQRAEQNSNHQLISVFQAAKNDARSRFKVWQDEFHPEAIYIKRFFLQKLDYIHNNPVQNVLADSPDQWHYSSFIAYETGQMGIPEIVYLDW